MSGKYKSLSGHKFGKLLVIGEKKKGGKWYCSCLCDCGKVVDVRKDSLSSGKTISCGCQKATKEKEEQLKAGRKLTDHTADCFFKSDTISKNNTSGIRGVSYIKATKKYRATIGYKNHDFSLGEYNTILEAEKVRNEAVEAVKKCEFEKWIVEFRKRKWE